MNNEQEEGTRNVGQREQVEIEEKNETRINFAAVLRRILQNQLPLSETHPGYLLGFLNLLESEENLPAELENSLYGLQKVAKIWNNNTGKALKKGVIET